MLSGSSEKALKEEYENLSWQIREKELQISRILGKTLFWHEQLDPSLVETIAQKEAYLSSWYEKKKDQQRKLELLKQVEKHLKLVKKELVYKEKEMKCCYEQVGLLALQSYQCSPAKWRVYENIFAPALESLRAIAPKPQQECNPIHFFLSGCFRQNTKMCSFLKRISRPVGERILQLNLLDFLRQQSLASQPISSAANHEQGYTTLLRKRRNLENNRKQLIQDIQGKKNWIIFFKNFLKKNSNIHQSPKLIMLELEQFYTSILKKYLDSAPEKIPANIAKALEELKKLKEKKENVQKAMLKPHNYPLQLRQIKKALAQEEKLLKELYERIKIQELKIQGLKEKEKELASLNIKL